jgi:hypothetical protein
MCNPIYPSGLPSVIVVEREGTGKGERWKGGKGTNLFVPFTERVLGKIRVFL